MRRYVDMGIRWTFTDPNKSLYGSCLVCGEARLMVMAEIPNDKTGTYDTTRSLQCRMNSGHSQTPLITTDPKA